MPLLQRELSQVVCFTTDMGAEMGFADMSGLTLREILPSWTTDSDLQLEHDCEDAASAAQPDVPGNVEGAEAENFFLPCGLAVPGLNHIIDNMCSDCNRSMSRWDDWLVELRPLVALIHHKHLRQRFAASCVMNTQHAWTQKSFETGMPMFASGVGAAQCMFCKSFYHCGRCCRTHGILPGLNLLKSLKLELPLQTPALTPP